MTDETIVTPASAGVTLMHIADRVIGRPLLLHPTKAEVVMHVLQGRLPLDATALAPLGPDANRFAASSVTRSGMSAVDKGVAIIPVIGSLVNRGAWIGARSGMTSYEGLTAQIRDAVADPKVNSILLDIDSPGGEATGMFSLAAQVREAAAQKPVVAVVNDMAASGAYGIASQATEVVVSPTSIVGSIGVVLTHLDRSGEMEKKGVAATLIYAGRHKVDGNPFGPLTDAVRADLQAEVGKFYDQFVSLVAQGRGDRLTEQDARATEARTFLGQEAIDRGLADRMASFDAVLASLQSQQTPRGGAPKKGSRNMATENDAPQGVTQEAHTAAVAAARAEGMAEGRKAGATEATARIGAILGCDAAKTKPTLAKTLALDTDMSADAAEKVLAAAAPEVPAATTTHEDIGARSAGQAEFGAAPPAGSVAERSASGWKKAVDAANKSIGAAR